MHSHRCENIKSQRNIFCSSLIYTFNIIWRESFHVTPCQHEWILRLSRGSRIHFTPVSDVQKAHHSLRMNSYERNDRCIQNTKPAQYKRHPSRQRKSSEGRVNKDGFSIQCRHFEIQTLLALYLNCHKSIIYSVIIASIQPSIQISHSFKTLVILTVL